MKRLILVCSAAFLLASCNNAKTEGETTSKDSASKMDKSDDNAKKEPAWIPVDSAASMKAMMEASQLGEPHKMLAKSNGTWTADMTYWEKPGGNPQKMSGTMVTTSILDGHFQQSTFSGDMMGMPFKGVSTVGYDNIAKEYVSTWVENMSTGIVTMRGTWDNSSNSITFTGKEKNPANGIDMTLREVFKIVDDNNQIMEYYGPDPQTGKEYKMMEAKYTRKK